MKKLFAAVLFSCLCFAAYAQNVNIDMRYNVRTSEPSRDFFNWSTGTTRIQDNFDAISGASASRSTREFDRVRFDANRRYTMPRGIRHLLLFPIASRRYTDNFFLNVLEEDGKLIIRFIVYGTAYQIQTDTDKKIDITTACFIAEEITQNNSLVSPLRAQYVRPGGNPNDMNSLDWSRIRFVPDAADADASRKYRGILTAGYSNGILTIQGVLE